MRSDRTLLKWYRRINKRFFDGACPDKVCVRWADPEMETQYKWEEKWFGEASKVDDDPYHEWQIVMRQAPQQEMDCQNLHTRP